MSMRIRHATTYTIVCDACRAEMPTCLSSHEAVDRAWAEGARPGREWRWYCAECAAAGKADRPVMRHGQVQEFA